MDSENRYTGIDETISHIIRCKARQLVGHAGFTSADLPDLEQEFYIVILEHIHKVDHDQGSDRVFLNCIVCRCAKRLVKSRQAQRRDWRLFAPLPDEDSLPLPTSNFPFEAVDTRLEAEKLIRLLPAELVQLAHRLMVMTPHEISKKYSIPRTNIYRQIEAIRRIFGRKAKNKPDTFPSFGQLGSVGENK